MQRCHIMRLNKCLSDKCILLGIFLIFLSLSGLPQTSHGDRWRTQTIDDPRFYLNFSFYASDRDVAIEDDGTINSIYGDIIGDLLLAQTKAESEIWTYSTLYAADIQDQVENSDHTHITGEPQ